ncbi:hypothetical protein AAF712_010592 [Marasmius tenuissimus]|uniref:C2H2-type domain-containing protein n=1 Tax=Marasmius tenuissimus TaxID=585030 RepID=A0ABR2ZP90_9AGAR
MSRHMKTHAENKSQIQHGCPWPGCSFSNLQRSNVTTHYRTHTGDKNKKCPDCDFRTVDPGSLTRHRKRQHQYVPVPRKARGTGGQSATATTRATRRHAPYSRSSPSSSSESLIAPVFCESKYTALALAQSKPATQDQEGVNGYFWRIKDTERITRSPSPKIMYAAVDTGRHMEDGLAFAEGATSNGLKLDLTQDQALTFDQPTTIGNWDFAMPTVDFNNCTSVLGENWMGGMVVNEAELAQCQPQQWSIPETLNFGLDLEAPCVQQQPQQQQFLGTNATDHSHDWTTSFILAPYYPSSASPASSESTLSLPSIYSPSSPSSLPDVYSASSPFSPPCALTPDSSFSLSPPVSEEFVFAHPSPVSSFSSPLAELSNQWDL